MRGASPISIEVCVGLESQVSGCETGQPMRARPTLFAQPRERPRLFAEPRYRQRLFADAAPGPRIESKVFEAPPYWGSVYHKWARGWLRKRLYLVTARHDIDDLLQEAFIKYAKCVRMYVVEKGTCRTASNLMALYKRAIGNMVNDMVRLCQRLPAICGVSIDVLPLIDNTFESVEEHCVFH